MPPIVVALIPIAAKLLPILLPLVFGWLGTLHFKNTKAQAALDVARAAAQDAAKIVAQPYVDELAKDAGDGVITPEEQAAADANACKNALSMIPPAYLAVLETLFPGDTLNAFISNLIKSAAHDLALARAQAFASVPGLTSSAAK